MKQLWSRLLVSSGLRQSAITIVGNTLTTGVSALALILISRVLGPEKFGEFSVGFAIVLIITRFNDAGLSSTILKFAASTDDHATINTVFSLTTRYKLLLSLVIVIAGVLCSPWIASVLRFPHPELIAAAFIFGVVTVYYEQLLAMLQSLHLFSEAVVSNAVQSGVKLVTIVAFFLLGWSSTPLIFSAYVAAPLVPVLLAGRFMPKWVSLKLNVQHRQLASQILNLAKHASVAFISAGIIENVDVLFVQKYLNTYETGLLSGVSRIAMMFALIAYSLGNVLNPRVSRYKDSLTIKRYLKKAGVVAGLAVLGFFAFLPFAQLSILATIGPQYVSGLPILLILLAASFLTIATIPFIALFYSFDASWYFSASGLGQLAIVLIGNWLFVPVFGLEAAAWTRLASRVFLFGFTTLMVWYLYRRSYVQANHH